MKREVVLGLEARLIDMSYTRDAAYYILRRHASNSNFRLSHCSATFGTLPPTLRYSCYLTYSIGQW